MSTDQKASDLSDHQLHAVRKARENGGRLLRLAGGFWTYPGCPMTPNGIVPEWWTGTQTIEVLTRRKVLRVTELTPWKRPQAVELVP